MLLEGFNHVAVLTKDTERFHAFYREVFGAEVTGEVSAGSGTRLTFVKIGSQAEFNVFEIADGASREIIEADNDLV